MKMPVRSIAIETSTDVCSVALAEDGQTVALSSIRIARRHAEMLVPTIKSLLHQAAWSVKDLDYVAISDGPGSYTGLRIGVSTAKGLSFAASIPLIGVSTLHALAYQVLPVANRGDLIIASFDARRKKVYAAMFEVSGEDELIGIIEPVAATGSDLAEQIPEADGTIWMAGDGTGIILSALPGTPVRTLDLPASAESVAALSHLRWTNGERDDPASLEPRYLREFVAENPARSAFENLPF